MTELKFEKYTIPAANMGAENTLPDIHGNAYIRSKIRVSDRVPAQDRKYINQGMISTLLPYSIQDGYDRAEAPRDFDAAILENEEMRAVFLPSLGGRLWSLYDKKRDRELLYKNDVFRPAHLALRNAWNSGGVEWNVGIKGHNPLTCAPLFAQKVLNTAGEPILRMYEFERIRGIVYSIEASLSGDALLMHITVENTDDKDVYMYWWSNIAVPETKETRVIVPTEKSFFCWYSDGGYALDKGTLGEIEDEDVTYPAHSPYSRDFFYDIPKECDKWIASVDKDGKGLLHFSDPILQGRKLFLWGQHNGGRHWNEWLTKGAGPYIEIQAGLLKTQLEHFIMPKKSTISWQECYMAADLAPEVAHGDFAEAGAAVSTIVSEKLSLLKPESFAVASEKNPTYYGSGWGAMEEKLRGESISDICRFPEDSIGAAEADFLSLLEGKGLPSKDASVPIVSHVVGKRWLALMEKQPTEDWYYYNHLGVMRYADGDFDGAAECFEKSFALCDNAWARRNLAQIQKNIRKDFAAASENMLRAVALCKDYTPLWIDCISALMSAERYADAAEMYESFPASLRENGRIRMYIGACYTKLSDFVRARALLCEDLVVPDIREGEYALSNVWIELYGKILAEEKGVSADSLSAEEILALYPLPYALDFRMH